MQFRGLLKLKTFIKKFYESLFKLPYLSKPLPVHPFGKVKWAPKDKYRELHESALKVDDSELMKFEIKTGFQLNKNWWSNLALHTQVVIKKEPLNFFHGRLLYSLLSNYINKNKNKKY